jgi:hypothetical protein
MKRRGLLSAAVFGLIVITDIGLFGMNVFAFAWHVRHGFHREVNGTRFWVPLFYQERESPASNQFSINSYSSPVRREYSSITVEFPPWSSGKTISPMPREDAERMGLTQVARRSAKLGRRSGICIEYAQDGPALSGPSLELLPRYIECRLGSELQVSFEGSRNAVPELYAFMESATEVNH